MRTPCLTAWLLLLLLSSSQRLLASDPYYRQFNTANGLPSSEVYNIALDELGMPWFVTDRGLCRYNGFEIKAYSTKDGLSNNTLLDYFVGPKGKLWFTGLDCSFTIVDGTEVYAFAGNDELAKLIDDRYMLEGFVWDTEGRIYLQFRVAEESIIVSFHPDKNDIQREDIALLRRQHPLLNINEIEWLQLGKGFFPLQPVKDYVVVDGNTFFHNGGDISSKLMKGKLGKPASSVEVDLGTNIHTLVWEKGVGLWVSTARGIFMFPDGDLNQKPKRYFDGICFGGMVRDKQGNYWIASLEEGVFMVPSFEFYRVRIPNQEKAYPKITALLPMDHNLLFATIDGELLALNETGTITGNMQRFGSYGSMSLTNRRGNLGSIGIHILKEENGEVHIHMREPWRAREVLCLLSNGTVVKKGNGGEGFGLKTKRGYKNYSDKLPVRVLCMMETEECIWIGTLDGLWKIINFDFDHPVRAFRNEKVLQGRINDILPDRQGGVWFSTIGDGLVYVREDKVTALQTSQGLNSNMVNRAAIDSAGAIWVGTNQGLNRVKYAWDDTLQVTEILGLNSVDGLPDNYIHFVSLWQGEVWLATNKGLVHFAPEVMDHQMFPSVPVFLEDVQVNRQSVDRTQSTRLAHSQNDIAFRFQGISMRKPSGSTFFRYRLLGTDTEWRYTNERTVRYLNLPAGSYRFEVSAQSRNGNWTPTPANYAFEIRPHFSQTWWFRTLMVVLLVGLVWALVSYRAYRIRQQKAHRLRLQEAQLNEQKARLKAQEAEISALRSQMNPHFVFNALNSIQNFIFDNDIVQANHFLSCFAWLMRDGLDFSQRSAITLAEELTFLRSYLKLEKMRFPDRFTYKFHVGEDLDPEKVHLPPYLFQPLLENAVKHAFKDISVLGKLEIRFDALRPGWIKVSIRDNGLGFDPASLPENNAFHRSMGLKIVRDRIALLKDAAGNGATFTWLNLASELGQGMLAEFEIPLQQPQAYESAYH